MALEGSTWPARRLLRRIPLGLGASSRRRGAALRCLWCKLWSSMPIWWPPATNQGELSSRASLQGCSPWVRVERHGPTADREGEHVDPIVDGGVQGCEYIRTRATLLVAHLVHRQVRARCHPGRDTRPDAEGWSTGAPVAVLAVWVLWPPRSIGGPLKPTELSE